MFSADFVNRTRADAAASLQNPVKLPGFQWKTEVQGLHKFSFYCPNQPCSFYLSPLIRPHAEHAACSQLKPTFKRGVLAVCVLPRAGADSPAGGEHRLFPKEAPRHGLHHLWQPGLAGHTHDALHACQDRVSPERPAVNGRWFCFRVSAEASAVRHNSPMQLLMFAVW